MATVHLIGGRKFVAEPGVTLLEAASASGIAFPYSCRSGRCSTCKALVQRGQTCPRTEETGLSYEEINAGWILTCVRSAVTDVDLDIEDLGTVTLPQAKTYPCRIAGLEKLAPNVLRVSLRLPPTADFSFVPGQYIDLIGPNGIRRSYSLANAGNSEKFLELHIRAVDGGTMSDYLFRKAKINDLLRLNGPLGTFFLRKCENTDVFFLATGTGIAPIKAMLESLAQLPESKQPQSVTVLWGARKFEDLYIDLAAIPGRHRYIPVISRPSEGWSGATGYVQNNLRFTSSDLSKIAVYACGSDDMIRDARRLLFDSGLQESRFYSDAFVSSGEN